jgi:hypothetical protein
MMFSVSICRKDWGAPKRADTLVVAQSAGEISPEVRLHMTVFF